MEKPLRVKLFGESIKIHRLKVDDTMMSTLVAVANTLKLPLHEALLDFDFFRVLNATKIQCLHDLLSVRFCGLIHNSKNQVEVTYGRKRIAKFNMNELIRPTTLFALYNTQLGFINLNDIGAGIYVEEREIGLIGTYEVIVEDFQIDLLKFCLVKTNYSSEDFELLSTVKYENIELPNLKSDSLLSRQVAFVVE